MTASRTTKKAGNNSKRRKPVTVAETGKRPKKTSRKYPAKSAAELLREAWEYTYANRHRRLDI